MSKELKNITESVMGKIHHGEVKMRPKMYFVIGSIFTFLGLVLSILTTIFLIGLIRFSFFSHGRMGEYKVDELLSHFSWFGPSSAILGLVIGLWLLHRYDFSYKINFKIVIIIFVTAIITAGIILDMTGLNDVLFRRGMMKAKMRDNVEFNFKYMELRNNQKDLHL